MTAADNTSKQILGQLLSQDAELQKLARDLVILGLREMVNVMKRGNPADKVAIAKSLAGVLTRPLMEDAGDDTASELATEMRQMMAEVRGTWAPEQAEDEQAVAPVEPAARTKGKRPAP